MIVFEEDILVYSSSFEEHYEHLRKVLQTLGEQKLYTKFKKCKCGWITWFSFDMLFPKDSVDPTKIDTIRKWERLKSITKI